MERTMKVVLGDWSDDGHGKTDTHLVRLSGIDVSDEALNHSYRSTSDALQMDLVHVCEDYEDFSITAGFYNQLLQHGFAPTLPANYYQGPVITVEHVMGPDGHEEVQFSAIELLMFYVGGLVEDFKWELVSNDFPLLIGGSNSAVKQEGWAPPGETNLTDTTSFGYGLFF